MTGMASLLPTGTTLHHYRIEGVLGSGGFGVTYRAYDRRRKCTVAIKEYFPRTASRRSPDGGVQVVSVAHEEHFRWGLARFVEEAQTLARFDHPNILRVLQYFGLLGTAYLVLEYIEGQSLEQWLTTTDGAPSQETCVQFTSAVLDALETLHRNDILHRDLAPKNILLRPDSSPVLIDFGSARQMMVSRGGTMTAIVTPSYAPYEQYVASGQGQGPWTDIYAAAAILYRMLMGKPPPEAPHRALDESSYEPLTGAALQAYRPAFLQAIDWGLRTHPKERPKSVAEWREALLANAPGLETGGNVRRMSPQQLIERIKETLRRHRL
jgi:serine/threonine protein kinase